jgi:transcription-repair coupling factor (superfamily II helicase)
VGGLSGASSTPTPSWRCHEGRPAAPRRPRPKKQTSRQKLDSYADLSPGDLVVHEHHGIGRYVGMVKMTADGVQKDYVKINYAGADVLYVPATQLDLVSKYIGAGENVEAKKLSKLGGADWEKAKTRAKKAVADLAKGLIQLYAERQRLPAILSPDSPWQKSSRHFEYTETDDHAPLHRGDQADMERQLPWTGSCRTCTARRRWLRSIMKCVLDASRRHTGPTTVLPGTLSHRQAPLRQVSVESTWSRFRTAGQIAPPCRSSRRGSSTMLIAPTAVPEGREIQDLACWW